MHLICTVSFISPPSGYEFAFYYEIKWIQTGQMSKTETLLEWVKKNRKSDLTVREPKKNGFPPPSYLRGLESTYYRRRASRKKN
jgi:hypothetical protein